MDSSNPFDTSFIPQRPAVKLEPAFRPRVEFNLAMAIALALLFAVIAASGGMYFWRISIEKNIAEKEASLASMAGKIDMQALRELELVAARLSTGRKLLENHYAFSSFLDLLEKTSLRSITITKLEYTIKEGVPAVQMSMSAPNYMSVYVQEETWKHVESAKKVVVSDVSLDQSTGRVNFNVRVVLAPAALQYSELLKRRTAGGIAPVASTTP